MIKATKDLILSVFRSYKKEYPLTEHILLNIEAVERMLEIEPILEDGKDCNYCCGDVDERSLLLSDGSDGVYISGNGELVGDDIFDFVDKKINYCPVCGRNLNKK